MAAPSKSKATRSIRSTGANSARAGRPGCNCSTTRIASPEPCSKTSAATRKFKAIPWNEAINTLYEKLRRGGRGGRRLDRVEHLRPSLRSVRPFYRRRSARDDPIRYDLYTGLNGYDVLAAASDTLLRPRELPTYDLSHADTIFSFGADFLGTWLSPHRLRRRIRQFPQPGLRQARLSRAVRAEDVASRGAKADRWVPIRPGAEALVAQAIDQDHRGQEISDRRIGSSAPRSWPVMSDLEDAAAACEMTVEELVELARVFADGRAPGGDPWHGADRVGTTASARRSAVQALNVIAGTLGQPGGDVDHARTARSTLLAPYSRRLPMSRRLIERMNGGEIKVLLVHGANPAYDLPRSCRICRRRWTTSKR